jgi:hypothetical protein
MAAQSILDLSNPFNRLGALPQAINWRGGWDPVQVFYRNDVVISPMDNGSYINISPGTTITGGTDPSVNFVNWYAFGAGAAGLQNIVGTQYLLVSNQTAPLITNNGVTNAITGQHVNNLGTQNNPILEDLGLTSITPNVGIAVAGNQITNVGATQLQMGNGFANLGDINNVSLSFTGPLSISAYPGSGITVGGGANPLISNTGLLTLNAGVGIVNSSTNKTPNFTNNGVIDISGGKSILVEGFPFVKLSTDHPSVSLVGALMNAVMTPSLLPGYLSTPIYGQIPITQTPGTFWATSIATQNPFNSGTYTLNFGLSFLLQGPILAFGNTRFSIYDSNLDITYSGSGINQMQYNRAFISSGSILPVSAVSITVDLADLWASGFRTLTHLQVSQIAVLSAAGVYLSLQNQNTNVYATYSQSVI